MSSNNQYSAAYFTATGNDNSNSNSGGGSGNGNGANSNSNYGPSYWGGNGNSNSNGNSSSNSNPNSNGNSNSNGGVSLAGIAGLLDAWRVGLLAAICGVGDGIRERQNAEFAGMLDAAFEQHNRCLWDSWGYRLFTFVATILLGIGLFWVFTHDPFLVKEIVNGNTTQVSWDIMKLIGAGVLDLGVLLSLIGIGVVTKRR